MSFKWCPQNKSSPITYWLVLSLISLFAPMTWGAPEKFKIVIDPGHGGSDRGAVYGKGVESEIALQVSKTLQKLLNQNANIEAFLTRDRDVNLSLPLRIETSEKIEADLFISIHANASVDGRAKGAEFYIQNQAPFNEEIQYLAHMESQIVKESEKGIVSTDLNKKSDVKAILEDLKRQSKIQKSFNLGKNLHQLWSFNKLQSSLKQAPFYVITNSTAPSVLIEIGFLSHPKESLKLQNINYQRQIAENLVHGILSYKEKIDKTNGSRLQ